MRVLIAAACLLVSSAALAEDRPPVWLLVLEFKSGIISANYASEAACKSAMKTASPHVKNAANLHCLPVLAQ